MHYGKNFFSKNSGMTIVTKLPQYQDKIGQRKEMSHTDVYKLNRLYSCSKLPLRAWKWEWYTSSLYNT